MQKNLPQYLKKCILVGTNEHTMDTETSIALRLRFYTDINETIDSVRQKFIQYKKVLPADYQMKIRHNHIQFTIVGEKQRYWSPHLSIELEEKRGSNGESTQLRGLFGPAQTMWTFFIFLHFIIAGVFLVFAMFAFTNYLLKTSFTKDLIIATLMIASWILLYFVGLQTRENGYEQMIELEKELYKILN